MGTPFNDLARVHDEDLIAPDDAFEPMRDKYDRAPAPERLECLHQKPLVVGIQSACRLIQDEERGLSQKGAGNRKSLALSPGQVLPSLRQNGVVTLRQILDEAGRSGQFSRSFDLALACARPSISNVGGNAGRKHEAVLRHKCHMGPGVCKPGRAQVNPIEAQCTSGWIIEP